MRPARPDSYRRDRHGHFVPNISFGTPIMQSIRGVTEEALRRSPHDRAGRSLSRSFARAGADIITVHAEAGPHLDRTLQVIKAMGKKAGVSLNPATPCFGSQACTGSGFDLILVMSVNPGFGGQAFIPAMLDKDLGTSRDDTTAVKYSDIQVDGGHRRKMQARSSAQAPMPCSPDRVSSRPVDHAAAIKSFRMARNRRRTSDPRPSPGFFSTHSRKRLDHFARWVAGLVVGQVACRIELLLVVIDQDLGAWHGNGLQGLQVPAKIHTAPSRADDWRPRTARLADALPAQGRTAARQPVGGILQHARDREIVLRASDYDAVGGADTGIRSRTACGFAWFAGVPSSSLKSEQCHAAWRISTVTVAGAYLLHRPRRPYRSKPCAARR